MIPSTTATVTQTGSLPGKTTLMSIDQVHMPHIMEILTRQYSDIIVAILREYSANAWDAHVAAGREDVPIQVRTPNKFHPYLEIEDFGSGMSIDFVENEFSKYGASTKRSTNKEAGAFGIGGKSALAYCDSFTMTTVKDGVEGVFVISRNEEGAAQIITVDTRTTDKPNGTLVSIPAKNNDDFDAKVDWFFKFWKPGTVLVDGVQPRQMKAEKLADDVYYTPEGNNSYVVMGNIPYRVAHPGNYMPMMFSKFSFVVHVPIGSVSITPSREDLEYGDENTINTLRHVGQVFKEKMLDKIKKEILDQPDHFSAWEKWNNWRRIVGDEPLKDLKYKGDQFVTVIEARGYEWNRNRSRGSLRNLGYGGGRYVGGEWIYGANIPIRELKHVVVKDKATPVSWHEPTSYERQKTKWYFQSKGVSPGVVYFLDEVPDSPWVEGMEIHEWSEVKKSRDPNYTPKARQRTGGGKVMVFNANSPWKYWDWAELDDISTEQMVIITPADVKNFVDEKKLANALTKNGLQPHIVRLAENRWEKFKRDYDVVTLEDYLKDQIRLTRAAIPDISWKMRVLPHQTINILTYLKHDKIEDPELSKLTKEVAQKGSDYSKDFENVAALGSCHAMVSANLDADVTFVDPVGRDYPLLHKFNGWGLTQEEKAELYIYINAKYKDKK